MSSKNKIYVIAIYIIISGLIIIKHGFDTGDYLKAVFGMSSVFFLIALIKLQKYIIAHNESSQ